MQIHVALSPSLPTEWKGTGSVVCLLSVIALCTTILPFLHFETFFQKRALNFLVAIFSPWSLVTSVITWHIFVCKHPAPCLSTCKWDNCYCCCCTKALVQMIAHGHITMIWKNKPKHDKKITPQKRCSSRTEFLFLYCVPFTIFKIYIVTQSLESRQKPLSSCLLWHEYLQPTLPFGTGNNPTLSGSHHAKNVPTSFSKMHNFSPPTPHVYNPGMPKARTRMNAGPKPAFIPVKTEQS